MLVIGEEREQNHPGLLPPTERTKHTDTDAHCFVAPQHAEGIIREGGGGLGFLCRRCAVSFTCAASSDPTHGYGEGGGRRRVGCSDQAKISAQKNRNKKDKTEERKGEEEEGGVGKE